MKKGNGFAYRLKKSTAQKTTKKIHLMPKNI